MSDTRTSRGGRAFSGVENTLRDLWTTRPDRPRRGRKIAGVAMGIARRYQIDPIVVRITLVVATFYGGAGVVVYLLGWLLLAEECDEASPLESMVSERRSSTSVPITVLLCAALFPAVAWQFSDAYGVLGLVMLGVALFLLHRGRGELGRPDPPAREPAAAADPETMVTSPAGTAEAGSEPSGTGLPETPPAWDPLGAAPFAWDLPEPSPATSEQPSPEEPRGRSRAGMVTLGVLLIVAAGCVTAAPHVSWLTPGHIAGLLLGVLGIGMVAGSFAGSGRGLILLAVPLSAAGVLLTLSPFSGGRFEGIGEINERPVRIEDVQSSYNRTIGAVELDLTGLPETGEVPPITVHVGTGAITVRVPENADVGANCSADTGAVTCLSRTRDGVGSRLQVTDLGPDGRGGLKLTLDIRSNLGSVEVYRG